MVLDKTLSLIDVTRKTSLRFTKLRSNKLSIRDILNQLIIEQPRQKILRAQLAHPFGLLKLIIPINDLNFFSDRTSSKVD